MLQQITGPVFEYLAENRLLIQFARKVGLPLGGTLFVGGRGAEETIDTVKQFNQDGRATTVDYLGEFIETEQDAVDNVNECIKVIRQEYESFRLRTSSVNKDSFTSWKLHADGNTR